MRIALISFEYPIDTAWGGIATYVQQSAYMLKKNGYEVEVFCGTNKESYSTFDQEVPVFLCNYGNRLQFYNSVFEAFKGRHQLKPFDVLEVPEYATDAKKIMEEFPEIAVVVKTHSPLYLNNLLNTSEWSFLRKVKHLYHSIRQRKRPVLPLFYSKNKDIEYVTALKADLICSPSKSLIEIVQKDWKILKAKCKVVPNPLLVDQSYLNCEILKKDTLKSIAFIGRLEIRKGVIDLAKAIPKILEKHPHLIFYFIGQIQSSPNSKLTMQEYFEANFLAKYSKNIIFTGKIDRKEIPNYLSQIDVCIFPSIWENFPNVCLEAMSAGKAVIGSKAGGMSDMIEHLKSGYLIDPKSPKSIIEAVDYLVENPSKIAEFGIAARSKIETTYSYEAILPQQIQLYQEAIKIRKSNMNKSL